MNELKRAMEQWALRLVRKELMCNSQYRQLWEDQDALWEQFKTEQPEDAVKQHIQITDAASELEEKERNALFWLGLRLGVLIGASGEEE